MSRSPDPAIVTRTRMSRASARWTLLLALVPASAVSAADPPAVPDAEIRKLFPFLPMP